MIFDIVVFTAIAVILFILVRKIPEEKTTGSVSSIGSVAGSKRKKREWKIKFPSIKIEIPKVSLRLKGKKLKEDTLSKVEVVSAGIDKEKLRLADQFLSVGKVKKAEKIYVELAVQAPENPRIFNRLGAVYLKQKNYADARDSFLQALRIDNTKGSRHYNLGMAYMGMGVIEKAKVSFKNALNIEPGSEKYKKALQKAERE